MAGPAAMVALFVDRVLGGVRVSCVGGLCTTTYSNNNKVRSPAAVPDEFGFESESESLVYWARVSLPGLLELSLGGPGWPLVPPKIIGALGLGLGLLLLCFHPGGPG